MFSRLTMTIARSMDMEKPQGKAVMRTLAPPERSALIHRDYEQEQACQNRTVVEVHDVADPAVNGY